MKKIISLFFLTLMSSGVNAIQATPTSPIKVDFSGTFNGTVSGTGINSGDSFSGSFVFDLQKPDETNTTNTTFSFGYYLSQPQSNLSFNNQNINLQKIELVISDNFLVDQSLLDKYGLNKLIDLGTYDLIALNSDSNNQTFDSNTGDLTDGIEIAFIALFNEDSINLSDYEDKQPADLLNDLESNPLTSPISTVLILNKMENGSTIYNATGEVTDASVSAVPLPAAFWLFTSAIAALGLRFRQQA